MLLLIRILEQEMFVETSVSMAKVEDKNLIFWCYKPNTILSIDKAQEEVAQIIEMIEKNINGKVRLLIDIRGVKKMDKASRELFSSDYISDKYVLALGIVLGNPISKMIGNIYLKVNKPKHPTQLFTSVQTAKTWLNTLSI